MDNRSTLLMAIALAAILGSFQGKDIFRVLRSDASTEVLSANDVVFFSHPFEISCKRSGLL